jgi:hypothetical protein
MSITDANSLIETIINLKILDHPRKHDGRMQFTKRFDQYFKRVSHWLSADPATANMDTEEGLRGVVLNYLGLNKIDDDLLHDMCIMIFTLKMMIAQPGWKP